MSKHDCSDDIYKMYCAFLSRDFITKKCFNIESIPGVGIILTEDVPHSHYTKYYFSRDGTWKEIE